VYKYNLWIRINDRQTTNAITWADNDWAAKALAEAQYGQGNVLSYSRAD